MRRRALITTLFLAIALILPTAVRARTVHNFYCGNCHKATVSFTELGEDPLKKNVCVQCHTDGMGTTFLNSIQEDRTPQGLFTTAEASKALAAVPADTGTSHLWARKGDVVPAAGAQAPTLYAAAFNGRYGISRGKLTCTRCHNPHGYDTTAESKKLLKVANNNDQMCTDCHLPWNETTNSGLETHPMVADYQTRAAELNAAAAAANKEPRFKTSPTFAGSMQLVNGVAVSCSTCHAPHFVDSDSATPDGRDNRPGLGAGDGHLLRADGPAATDKSALCQSCHLYKRHGNPVKAQINVGCLVCHSGHSFNDDGPNPNYFVLRRDKVNPMDASPVPDQDYTALGTLLNDMDEFTQTGFCERCHGEAKNIPNHAIDRWLKDCRECHGHNVASANFSWQNDASVEVCGDCHGFPPYVNLRGDKLTGGTDGGYAYTAAVHNYNYAGYLKNEATTPHNSHAAGGLPQGAATDYILGTGQGACDPCHSGLANHRQDELAATYNATTFRDVAFGAVARGNKLYTIDLNATYTTTGNGSCTNVYCHSNGGKRTGDANKTSTNFTFSATAPVWDGGDADIIGIAGECYVCHGNNATNMASGQRNNSASHLKHVAKYACNVCHVQTATSATALTASSRIAPNGTHVNGKPDLAFDTAYDLDTVAAGTQALTFNPVGDNSSGYTSSSGTCAVYCHSNGGSTYDPLTYKAPDWDAGGSVVCGSCHGAKVGDATVIASGSHTRHVSDANGPTLACAECHVNAGSYTVAGGHADHINAAVNIDYARCTTCHAVDGGETTPLWGQPSTMDCRTCHSGSAKSTFESKTAPDKTTALTVGHNRPTASGAYTVSLNSPANKACTDCHTTAQAGHFDADSTDKLLTAAGSDCLVCHGSSGSATKRNIATHKSKLCVACHDPHGSSNVFMIHDSQATQNAKDTSGVGEFSGNVVFSIRGDDATPLLATDSYDEDDNGDSGFQPGTEVNGDDICATCHSDAAADPTTHNNREGTDISAGHHMGENCFTSCHKTHTEAAGAFISGGGDNCGACHGNPPATGAHRTDRGNRSLEETAAELHSSTASDYTDEPRDDCGFCHPGAEQYTYNWSDDQASLIPGRMNHNAGNRVTNLQNNLNVQYTQSGNYWYCAAACHVSSATDGYWFDKSAGSGPETWNKDADLNCNACHYYEVTIASNANNTAAGARGLTQRHDSHFNKQKTCSACHTVLADTTHVSIPGSGTDIQKIQNRAQAVQDEATVLPATLGTGSDLDPGNPTCAGAGVGLGCHNTKTTPAWDAAAASITCTNCHDPAGSATADPKTGLHNMNQANVQKHDSTITGGCTACHNSTKPATHADGTWQADQASNTESRFLNRTYLVYNDAGGPNMGTCFDNGASGAGSLDFAVSCHRDNGVWKRLWSTEADSTATTPGSSRCKACHGQYENLNTNQGGGWNEGTSHYLTLGGRSSVRGESHNSRNLGDASACEDCHSFDSLANHENGSITMNDAAVADDTDVNDTTSWVFCEACHVTGDPLLSGTFTFTKSTLAIQRVSGSYDPIQQCNSCHGVGGGGRYWPVAPNGDANTRNHAGRHEIHMDRLAKKVYNETVAQLLTDNSAQNPGVASDTKQKELCSYCHNSPGFNGHALESLPAEVNLYNLWNKAADAGATYSSNQHGAVGNDTCAGVNCHNNKLTVDNSYGWYDSTTGAGCVVCHTVGGTNDLPNNNIHPNSGLHNITPTVSGMQHDDSFSISGTCASCHTGIVTTIVGGTHINGTASADGPANTNAERGLFAAYSEAAVNSSTCAGSGVDNTANCHADGGTWNRRWSTTASVNDGATECANCHGTFLAGWRWSDPPPAGTTDHIDPSALNVGDAMGVALKHPDCQICHGWGKPGYDTAWHNKTVGVTPGHGDGRITMNGPDDVPGPGAGAKYDESTGGCAAACHSATWVMSDSGLTVNYGDYGGGSCSGCHGDGGSQYWPDGTPASPVYADNNADSAARHNTHILAISQYKWGLDLTGLKSAGDSDAKQKAVCAFCHGVNPGASGHNSDSGDSRVDVAGAGAFRMFTGSANDALDSGSGAYALATRSCSNLVCHNLVTTPTAAADNWEGTTAANCTTLCHGPNSVATAREGHQKHVVTKAYACTQCHADNGTSYGHINGIVNMVFTNAGSLEAAPVVGLGDALYTDGSFAYNRTTPTGTCTNVYCHIDKTTPAWNGTINTSTTGCVDCHTAGGAGTNPTTGLHDEVPRITGKQHSSSFTYNGGASTAYCSTCHTTTPSTNHVDGTFTTSWNAVAPSINFAAGVGFTDGTPPTCGATTSGCHKDSGAWKRKWHEDSPDATGLECAGCHGDWTRTWNTGVTHRTDSGPTSNHPAGTSYKCKDCHAFESTAYGSLTWGGNHGNSQITMNSNATSFARGTGGDLGKSGCATSCHVAFDGFVAGQHSFETTTWTLQTLSGDVIDAGCNGCHGNTSVGVGQYWPDGTVNKAQYAYADDNTTAAANHDAHIAAVAGKRYGETISQLLTDNTAGNPTLKSSDKQKAICAYCHPNPGAGGHTTDAVPTSRVDVNRSDTNGDDTPDTSGNLLKIVGGTTDTTGFFRATSTDKTCSQVACHANAPFTPGWYGDTVAPGNATLTAAAGPVPRSIRLSWVAVGDDGSLDGTAYKYDIRMSPTSSAIATDFSRTDNYVQGVPTVKRKGEPQEVIIHNVNPSTTYYFSLRTFDENVIADPNTTVYGTSNTASYLTPAAGVLDSTPPVLTGSPQWYGVDSAKALDTAGTVKLSWTRAEDHSMPITYDIYYDTGNIDYGGDDTVLSTKDTSFRVTGLTDGQTYNFAVRAKDAYNNTDTNTATLQAIPQGLSQVPKTSQVYYANGAISGSNVTVNTTVYTATGSSTLTTGIYFIVNSGAAYTAKTNVYADTFAVYVSNANASNTMTAELGYYDTAFRSFTATSPAQTALTKQVTLAARAKKVVPFKFGEMRWVPAGARLAVKLTQTQAGTVNWGSATNRGDLTTQLQPVNVSPTTPTVSTSVAGANVNIWWAASTDTVDGVADTVHYDVYGSANGGADGFPHVIATGLTTNATSGSPLVWDTQAAGIALSGAVTNMQVRVEAGDSMNGKTISHTASTSGNLSVNNSGDNVSPGTITNFKAETRPKQGSVYLTWTAPGDDGGNNGRAAAYDIRWATAVIDDDTKYNAATPLVSEPYPDFGGNGQGYEVLGLADGTYYFAIKAVDDGSKTSPLAYTTATSAAGPKCGICHSTPPDEDATKGNHAKHGFTIAECANCHGTEAATFATDHQDGAIKLGWKTATPATATVAGQTVTYYQDPDGGGPLPALKIYEDTSGSGGFNPTGGDTTDNGSCFNWSSQNISGCHGPATSASWDAAATLACSACHGDNSRILDMWGHSFDDQSDDVKASPPVDNHGYDGTGATEGERKYVGAHEAHLNYSFRLSKGDSCRLCHGSSRPGVSIHADGNIDVKLDLNAAGATAQWSEGAPTTAGTCSSMSPDSCHPSTATPKWDSNETFACTNCHGFGGTTPSHVTDTAGGVSAPDNGTPTEQMPGNCTWCHVGGHPKEKKVTAITKASPAVVTTENNHNLATNDKVTIHTQTGMTEINNKTFAVTVINATQFSLQGSNTTTYGTFDYGTWIEGNGFGIILVPNDSRVGIAYQSGGVHLKANVGARGEMGSEAELCWSCHDPNNISEWGADSAPANATGYQSGNGNNYNFGQIYLNAAGGTVTSNWLGDGGGAFWRSGYTPGFNYKDGRIRSTHSTAPTGSSQLINGVPYDYGNTANSERLDLVNIIRCSNCHDVHNLNKAPEDNPDNLAELNGPPYLRGTWRSSPYKEDGAPQQGATYTAVPTKGLAGYGYGLVPRANPSTTQAMGGYWIDQNSGNPTAGWSYETSAGLCQRCHGASVDALDYDPSGVENLWLSSNGHANSVLGGSGTGAANIFKNGITSGVGRQGTGVYNTGPWMGFQNTPAGSGSYYYGYRSSRTGSVTNPLNPYTQQAQTADLLFAWGATVDNTSPAEIGYHQFSCSKCHNPHASRLPKLMITNCLDVARNTWDNSYDATQQATNWNTWRSATISWNTNRISHTSAAQNCHRFVDVSPSDNIPEESGWNKVTPW